MQYRSFFLALLVATRLLAHLPNEITIENLSIKDESAVTAFWTGHTVRDEPFRSKEESIQALKSRNEHYPLFAELMNTWGDHENEVVLDYGCGPGYDLVGFLLYSKAKQVIGMDVSPKALSLARHHLSFHNEIDLSRVRLVRIMESEGKIPLPDQSVDYIFCSGVLHHTTDPLAIMKEFNRVLKKNGKARIMVYGRDSLWVHLYVAYQEKVLYKKYYGLNIEQAFARTADGGNCPYARCYRPTDFLALAAAAGFKGDYLGGYLSQFELGLFRKYGREPLNNPSLASESRHFLQELQIDEKGFPCFQGKYAGLSSVYLLTKNH